MMKFSPPNVSLDDRLTWRINIFQTVFFKLCFFKFCFFEGDVATTQASSGAAAAPGQVLETAPRASALATAPHAQALAARAAGILYVSVSVSVCIFVCVCACV
jgi:hypothetical protein